MNEETYELQMTYNQLQAVLAKIEEQEEALDLAQHFETAGQGEPGLVFALTMGLARLMEQRQALEAQL